MSNVTGTIVDVPFLVAAARAAGAHVLIDACQAVPQMPVDVSAWDADFVAFSSHKILGPTGIGALWARAELLEAMPPFLGGGEMIRDVTTDGFTTNDIPWKFEAGTPAIVEAVGMGAAIDYLERDRHGRGPCSTSATSPSTRSAALKDRFEDRLQLYGPPSADDRGGVISFLFDGIHAHDVSQVVDEAGVCVRAGHHCAKPLMRAARNPGHDTRVVRGLQRPGRRRRVRRSPRHRRIVLRDLKGPPCPACKTSTARSSSTITARLGTAASCRCRPPHKVEGFNPLCGDEVVLFLEVEDGVVTDVKTAGQGCSISQASTSMMSAAIKGKPVDDARTLDPRVQGADVDPRVEARRRRGDPTSAPSSKECGSATSRRCRAS